MIWIFSLSFTKTVKKFIQDNYNSWVNRDADDEEDIEEEEIEALQEAE